MVLDLLGPIGSAFGIGETIGKAIFGGSDRAGGADRGAGAPPVDLSGVTAGLARIQADQVRLLTPIRDALLKRRRGPPAPLPARPRAPGTVTTQGPGAPPVNAEPRDDMVVRAASPLPLLEGLQTADDLARRLGLPQGLDPFNRAALQILPGGWAVRELQRLLRPPDVSSPRPSPPAAAQPPSFRTGGSLEGGPPGIPGQSDAGLDPTIPGADQQRGGDGSRPAAGDGAARPGGSSAAAAAGGGRGGSGGRSRSSSRSRASCSQTVIIETPKDKPMSRMGNRKMTRSKANPTRRQARRRAGKGPASRKASPAQLEARRRFAERARSGGFRRGRRS